MVSIAKPKVIRNKNHLEICSNGSYTLFPSPGGGKDFLTITIVWLTPGIPAHGILVFNSGGEQGENNRKDLSEGRFSWLVNRYPPSIGVTVTDLPADARFSITLS